MVEGGGSMPNEPEKVKEKETPPWQWSAERAGNSGPGGSREERGRASRCAQISEK